MLLSYLTFQAMVPVLESLGPTAFVYPACRGVPAVDQWLLDACKIPASVLGGRPSVDRLLVPAIPNRFVAIVPSEHAKALGDEAVTAARDAWEKIAGKVYDHISDTLGDDAAWAGAWDAQVKGYWEFRSAVLPRKALQENPALRRELLGDRFFGRAEVVSKLRDYIDPSHRPGYLAEQDPVSRWGGDLAILAKIADAQREVAHFSKGSPQSMVPPKCTLMGDFEQIGPAEFSASQRFWEHAQGSLKVGGFRLRRGERLSAIGLIKRFWVPTHLASEWSFKPTETRLDDTATVAARVWLREAGIDVDQERRKNREWNGQWILSATADERDTSDEDGDDPLDLLEADCPLELGNTLREAKKRLKRAPPRYLAVLHFDGDHLGRWLKGELGPTVRACLHPKTLAYFVERGRALGRERDLEALLGTVRPLSPVRHASLSDALLRFSVDAVPRIVADHDGELVYAGGDDVIALLPLERALACANAIRRAYSEEAYMGRNATASAGLSVMHARSSLRGALDAARAAEKAAKGAGRDALGLAVLRRSGEHARVVMPWTGEKGDAVGAFVEALDAQRARFVEGEAGDRWVYKLRAETAVLRGLEDDAFRAEMRRLIGRTEGADATLATQIESLAERYASWWRTRKDAPAGESWQESFCVLVQSASFMARGGDER
ncbi:MAG: type III-B CRISPR-associated protein Cas10/Cmr2 [Polyangiales bacterium]